MYIMYIMCEIILFNYMYMYMYMYITILLP